MSVQCYNRRKFLIEGTKATLAVGVAAGMGGVLLAGCGGSRSGVQSNHALWMPGYDQSVLPYAWDALEPVIDKETMTIHYTKHAATYAKNLREAIITEKVDTGKINIAALLGNISKYSTKMRNNVGGHYNHELFWQLMKPGGAKKPSGKLLSAINQKFGSFEAFKTQFEQAAKDRFGSGWAWLIWNKEQQLAINSTPNQDNALMDIAEIKGIPLLGLDVWEHAYYLKYHNRRGDYISNWWKVVNWTMVQNRFELVIS